MFVEKPLCVTEDELDRVISAWQSSHGVNDGQALMVGFNRRFAPFVVDIKRTLAALHEPLMMQYRVNAGHIPASHWSQDPAEGGRIVGEGCHFVDLLIYLSGSRVRRVTTLALPDGGRYVRDNVVITLEFENGSIGVVTYLANGHKYAGKELLEIHGAGVTVRLDNYRTLRIHDDRGTRRRRAWLKPDKGHRSEWAAFAAFISGRRQDPMSFDSVVATMQATFAARRSLETGGPVWLD